MDDGAEGVHVAFWRVSWEFGRLPECGPGGIVRGEIESRVAEVCEDDVRVCGVAVVVAEEDVAGFDVAMAHSSPIAIAASGVEASVQELEG